MHPSVANLVMFLDSNLTGSWSALQPCSNLSKVSIAFIVSYFSLWRGFHWKCVTGSACLAYIFIVLPRSEMLLGCNGFARFTGLDEKT